MLFVILCRLGGVNLDLNPQSTHTVNIVTKKKFSIRKVLNLYGIFTFAGLIVSIFTIPLTFNVEIGFSRYEMELKDIRDFQHSFSQVG